MPLGLAMFISKRRISIMKNTLSSVLGELKDIHHRIRVKLYPQRLPDVPGQYIARTINERALRIEDICTTIKQRGGFEGDPKKLMEYVELYYKEVAYQLCNGFAVNNGLFTVLPNVGGLFDSPKEGLTVEHHPVTARFRSELKLKSLMKLIEVNVDGVADTSGYIHQFHDICSNTVNDTISGRSNFILTGYKIKVAGNHDDCGVYFVPIDEPDKRLKVQDRLTENFPSKIIGTTPMLVAPKSYRVEVVTQFTGSGSTLLKAPRTITSNFELGIA